MLLREKLVQADLAAAKLGIREVGGNNHGPWVKKFLAEVGLPEGYAWCDAFQSYEEHGVAGHKLPIESAGVEQTYSTALQLGWVVGHLDAKQYDVKADPHALDKAPRRGDLGCVNWTAAGPPFGDHIVLVISAVDQGSSWKLDTVEGNTSSGAAGSQGDGDGVFLRTRTLPKNQIAFVRIPGGTAAQPKTPARPVQKPPKPTLVPTPPPAPAKPAPTPVKPPAHPAKPVWYRNALATTPIWAWIAWRDHSSPPALRPTNIPKRIPLSWWARLLVHRGKPRQA